MMEEAGELQSETAAGEPQGRHAGRQDAMLPR